MLKKVIRAGIDATRPESRQSAGGFPRVQEHLVFIGDSLTEWFDWRKRFPDYRVTNLGVAGEPVEGLLDRRELIRGRLRDPDRIFLMTGINNIGMGRYEITGPYREIVRNLTTWYRTAGLVVQSILPVEIPGIENSVIEETNRLIEQIAREFDARYLDVYRRFINRDGAPVREYLDDDGVHLTGLGYSAWADEVERFLKQQT